MITGDIKETAQAIAREVGIISDEDLSEVSFTGAEFEALSRSRQQEILTKCFREQTGLIFSRAEPRHKKILVKELSDLVRRFVILYKN